MQFSFASASTPVWQDSPVLRQAVANQQRGIAAPPTLSAPRMTLGQLVRDKAAAVAKPVVGKRMASKLADLVDYSPVGALTTAFQAGQDLRNSSYGSAAVNTLGALLGALPDGGAALAKGGAGALHSIIAPLFHGSPHKFEKFALDKIGTGEGAQAYGHGLYFAENPAVAKEYQASLAGQGFEVNGEPLDLTRIDHVASNALFNAGGDIDRAKRDLLIQAEQLRARAEMPQSYGSNFANNAERMRDAAIYLHRNPTLEQPKRVTGGHLYEVKLDANPEDFLDWDKPLNEQPDRVRQAFQQIPFFQKAAQRQNAEVGDIYGALTGAESVPSTATLPAWQGSTAYRSIGGMPLPVGNPYVGMRDGPKSATMLNDLGVQGIRYLDQGSRSAGNGSRNYVVFNPDIISILGRQ
jgi:hypothetical protein